MAKAKIIGVGMYAPGKAISNEELKQLAHIEFDAAKIEARIGIKARHIAKLRGLQETSADFATNAAKQAITNAGIDPKEVGLFIVGSDTPEYISPSTALITQGRIQEGERWGMAFDINASCASFTTAFDVAARMLAANPALKYACVTGVYNMPAYIRDGDAFGYSIFSDGSGSVVLERVEDSDPSGYITGQGLVDGTQWDYVGIYTGGTKRPATHELLNSNEFGLQNLKPLPGDRNVRLWPMVVEQLLSKVNIPVSEIDHFVFTQINRSVIEKVMAALGHPMEKTTCIMDRYGYTGSGCVPMALYHAVQDKKIKRGDKVVFVASGAGLAVGSNLFTY